MSSPSTFASSQSSVFTPATTPEPSSTSGRVKKIIDLSLDSDDDVKAEENDSDDEVIFLSENSVPAPDTKDEAEDAAVAAVEGAQAELDAMYAVEARDAHAGEHADSFARLEAEGLSKKEEKKYREGKKAFKDFVETPHLNILDEETWSGCAMLYPTGPHVGMLRAEPIFKHTHITGTIQQAVSYPHEPERKHIGTLRVATRADLNIAVSAPASPFVWVSSPRQWNLREGYGNRQSVFMKLNKNVAEWTLSEWTLFGEYQMVWAGYLKDNEYRQLSPQRQETVLKCLLEFAKAGVAFAHIIYERCFVTRPDGSQVNVLHAQAAERKERVHRALLDNDGTLKIIWIVMACRGVNQAELDECRWKRGDPGAVEPIKPEESDDEEPDQARERSARRSKAPSVEGDVKPRNLAKAEPKREDEATPQPAPRRTTRRSRAPSVEADNKPDVKPKRRRVGAE
ncbi:hypothetical protein NBRC10513v2_002329 [Rhodotorula toruloides]